VTAKTDADHQTAFAFGGGKGKAVKRSTKANKRIAGRNEQLALKVKPRFLPVVGVPKTRADCPEERPCVHVRCKYNLTREEAEHRAGRPGLAGVPRDARGWTLPVKGEAGKARPGTTLRPSWMETERHCRAWLEFDSAGQLCAVNVYGDHMQSGSAGNGDAVFDAMRLHEGEELRVVSDDGKWATRAKWKAGAVVLERAPLIGQVVAVLITRVRPVSSCALDEIQRHGKMTNEQIGDAIGRHRTLVARQAKGALEKFVRNGREMGIEPEDLLGALIQMGEER
jgi:hypothetical protein